MDKVRRRSFSAFKVEAVYLAQDGCCARCGSSLEHGFHRHHRNGDPTDNSIENLELLCPSCHRASMGEAFDNYQRRLEWAVGSLSKLVQNALDGKIAGNLAETIKEAIVLVLKYARELYGLATPESPPPTVVLTEKIQEMRLIEEVYLDAFRKGFECGVGVKLKNE